MQPSPISIDIAQGQELEDIGLLYNIPRYCSRNGRAETDVEYRKRLLTAIRGGLWVRCPIQHIEFTITLDKPKCECGSEKAKVPGHSSWCPKFRS